MEKQYEIYLQTYSHINPNAKTDKDFETIDYEYPSDYNEAVKLAKALSKKVPYKHYHGQEIVNIQIACFYEGEEAEEKFGTSYMLLWIEDFEKGKSLGKYKY